MSSIRYAYQAVRIPSRRVTMHFVISLNSRIATIQQRHLNIFCHVRQKSYLLNEHDSQYASIEQEIHSIQHYCKSFPSTCFTWVMFSAVIGSAARACIRHATNTMIRIIRSASMCDPVMQIVFVAARFCSRTSAPKLG